MLVHAVGRILGPLPGVRDSPVARRNRSTSAGPHRWDSVDVELVALPANAVEVESLDNTSHAPAVRTSFGHEIEVQSVGGSWAVGLRGWVPQDPGTRGTVRRLRRACPVLPTLDVLTVLCCVSPCWRSTTCTSAASVWPMPELVTRVLMASTHHASSRARGSITCRARPRRARSASRIESVPSFLDTPVETVMPVHES